MKQKIAVLSLRIHPEMLLRQYLPTAVLGLLFFHLVPFWEEKRFEKAESPQKV